MKCEKCGKEIRSILTYIFERDGSDNEYEIEIREAQKDAVVFTVDKNWTGYELDEEEQIERIICPYCKKFPFKCEEVQVYEKVDVVCFKTTK